MENVTFETLPKAVSLLSKKLDDIERLLLDKNQCLSSEHSDELLTIDEAAELLHLTKPTLYSKHSKGEIPGVCKQGKRLYFSKQRLIDWIKSGQKKSNSEIQEEANTYIKNTK